MPSRSFHADSAPSLRRRESASLRQEHLKPLFSTLDLWFSKPLCLCPVLYSFSFSLFVLPLLSPGLCIGLLQERISGCLHTDVVVWPSLRGDACLLGFSLECSPRCSSSLLA